MAKTATFPLEFLRDEIIIPTKNKGNFVKKKLTIIESLFVCRKWRNIEMVLLLYIRLFLFIFFVFSS